MLETVAVLLILMWAFGMMTSTSLGGLVHVLLLLALFVIVYRYFTGRRAL